MIGWLQGEIIGNWRQGGKEGVVISCFGVGYEVQVVKSLLQKLSTQGRETLWVHQVHREDGYSLFGFSEKIERDFFRILIGVNGVGPQVAIALLEKSNVSQLVEAIIHGDLQQLSKAQGVGKRIAERLSLELRNKLSEFLEPELEVSPIEIESNTESSIQKNNLKELNELLHDLGYENLEIRRALKAIMLEPNDKGDGHDSKRPIDLEDIDTLLKETLKWLSKAAA